MPLAKFDVLAGYGEAFALVAIIQALVVGALAFGPLSVTAPHGVVLVLALAVLNALLGTTLGLFLSAFAATEFQAVQFLPAFVFPQLLLCGLLVPRDQMAWPLRAADVGVDRHQAMGSAEEEARKIAPAKSEIGHRGPGRNLFKERAFGADAVNAVPGARPDAAVLVAAKTIRVAGRNCVKHAGRG